MLLAVMVTCHLLCARCATLQQPTVCIFLQNTVGQLYFWSFELIVFMVLLNFLLVRTPALPSCQPVVQLQPKRYVLRVLPVSARDRQQHRLATGHYRGRIL